MISKLFAFIICLLYFSTTAHSQADTSFWFAAPELLNSFAGSSQEDRPIVLNISSYDQSATVTVSQPASGGMPTQTFTISPNTNYSIDLTNWIDNIECKPTNAILNNGLKISSTAKISVYYEVNANGTNPDLFSLKGKNALGTNFWISSQTIFSNRSGCYSSFNIVATENNTTVTINPSNNIVGHAAGSPFTITLNKGQTYAATAVSEAASLHLQGSHVTSNKPIAITLSDDEISVGPSFGGCQDLGGDQTVPTNIIGNEYIAIKGELNAPFDKVYLMAVSNGTIINQDGNYLTTLNAGQSFETSIPGSSSYFQSSNSFYAYQLSGIGCEVGTAILPKINCTGSSGISFRLTSNENLYVTILVKNGGQNNFLVNGSSGIIKAADFFSVPGTSNNWYAAKVALNYGVGSLIRVTSTSHLFHLGLLQGGTSSGTGFGYFSDFAVIKAEAKSNGPALCNGSTLQLFTDTLAGAIYSWKGPSGFVVSRPVTSIANVTTINSGKYILTATFPGCSTSSDTLNIIINNKTLSSINASICKGDTLWNHYNNGTFIDTFTGANGCDSIRTLSLTVKPHGLSNFIKTICQGNTFMGYNISGIYKDTFTTASANGCDSIRTIILTVIDSTLKIDTAFCQGNKILLNGSYQTTSGIYVENNVINNCPVETTTTLTVHTLPKPYLGPDIKICEGIDTRNLYPGIFQSYLWQNNTSSANFEVTRTGTFWVKVVDTNGCTVSDTLVVSKGSCPAFSIPNAFSPNGDGIDDTWNMKGLKTTDNINVEIYNRYGILIYKNLRSYTSWDGTNHGNPAPIGVYYYIVTLAESGKTYKGTLTLLR